MQLMQDDAQGMIVCMTCLLILLLTNRYWGGLSLAIQPSAPHEGFAHTTTMTITLVLDPSRVTVVTVVMPLMIPSS